jgi:hypothetical protein
VPVKSESALAMQALHRVRQGCMRRHTALGNQMRGLLLEHGIAMALKNRPMAQGVTDMVRISDARMSGSRGSEVPRHSH